MTVDLWFDFVCPFCYMGDKQFKEAIEKFDGLKDLKINYRSFQLDRSECRGKDGDTVSNFARKYDMPLSKAQHILEKTAKTVKTVGLEYSYQDIIQANTFDAHRLLYYAKEFNKGNEMTERIMKAHFGDGLDICVQSILADLGEEVGLDRDKIIKMLSSNQYKDEIAKDRKEAKQLNVDVVPTLIANNKQKTRISGVLKPKDYEDFLKEIFK